jgi:WD40 repeat protein
VRIWKVDTGVEVTAAQGHTDSARYLTFSLDGKTLASGARDGTIQLWTVATGKHLRQVRRNSDYAADVIFSPDSKALVSFGQYEDRKVRLWDLATQQMRWQRVQVPVIANMENNTNYGVSASFSGDGRTVAVASLRSVIVSLLDTDTGGERKAINVGRGAVEAIAISPDSRVVAVGRGVGKPGDTVELRDVATGGNLARLEMEDGEAAACTGLVFSHDGKLLASLQEGAIRVWETSTRKLVHDLKREQENELFVGLSFTAAGRLLALSGGEYPYDEITLWDVFAGKKIHSFKVEGNEFYGLALSPDGKMMATSMRDTTILLWDLHSLWEAEEKKADPIAADELARLWGDLNGTDAKNGFQAVQTLSTVPDQALALLKKHLKPVPESETKRQAQLIVDLSSRKYRTRKKAMVELEKLGEMAEVPLRRALSETSDLEMRMRIETLLKKREGAPPSIDVVRVMRAIQLLERLGTSPAKQLLTDLAKGAPEALLTLEATNALTRLARWSKNGRG